MRQTDVVTAVQALATAEREAFADLLAGLTAEQWDAASLCAGWTVRDVAVHTIAYLDQSRMALARNMFTHRRDVDRLNADALAGHRLLTPARLVELMRQQARPAGAGALYGGRVALIECLIHQQDIRRPLRLPRVIDPEALLLAMTGRAAQVRAELAGAGVELLR